MTAGAAPTLVRSLVAAAVLVAGCGGAEPDQPVAPVVEPVVEARSDEPIEPDTTEVRFVSQNLLHGLDCPAETNGCELESRVQLFAAQVSEAGCPELVSIQEVNHAIVALLDAHPPAGCDYRTVWDGDQGLDREVVMTSLDLVGFQRRILAGRFRSAFLVRTNGPAGVVDFVTAHLASTDDGSCEQRACPPPCTADDSLRVCQARQIVEWALEVAVDGGITVLGGDLNAEPGDPTVAVITTAGFGDSHLSAGLEPCDPATGSNCTSGRDDSSMIDLSDPGSRQERRIDYLFFGPESGRCSVGENTGLFNAEPAGGVVAFPSDHTGVILELECETVADPVAAPLPAAPPDDDVGPPGEPDPATDASIVAAFETFFDGSLTDVELRLDHLESAAELTETFLDQVREAGDLATETSARVEEITLVSDSRADVVFTILVGGSVVFDRIVGAAVRVDGRWLVAADTFCELAVCD